MSDIVLVCLTRDPEANLEPSIVKLQHKLSEIYNDRIVFVSRDTAPKIKRALTESGWTVTDQREEGVGESRRDALQIAKQENYTHIHLCDLDRALHWVSTYPDEMKRIHNEIPNHDFLILGRTHRAFETHPEPQKLTENLTNQFFRNLTGQYVDVNAASRGISSKAAQTILNHSQAISFETDVEWPLIIKQKSHLRLSYLEVEGLEFETHLKHQKEIEAFNGIEQWKKSLDQDPQEWLKRATITKKMIETAIQTLNNLT
jgi:hypothetical protein